VNKKPPYKPSQSNLASCNPQPSSKTLVVSNTIEYNIIEDMNKIKVNISLHELSNLKQHQTFSLKELNAVTTSPLHAPVVAKAANAMGKSPIDSFNKVNASNAILIGDISNSHTPPFLLSYEIYNRNVHNSLIDSRASSNIMPYSICEKLNIAPQKSTIHIVELDRTNVKVLGEINSISIRLSSNPKVC